MAEYGRVFEQLTPRGHAVELCLVDEMIVATVDLARTARSGCYRNRERQGRVALQQPPGHCRLAGTGRRGQHQQKAAAADCSSGAASLTHSRFCTCSRNCSTATLSDRPIRVSSISADFEHSVLASRFSSWHRKSS